MQRGLLAAFIFVALSLLLGMDFFQNQKAAQARGEPFGVTEYFGGVTDRYAAFRAGDEPEEAVDQAAEALEIPAESVADLENISVVAAEDLGVIADAPEVAEAEAIIETSEAKKPVVRRFGSRDCAGTTFKRCSVQN